MRIPAIRAMAILLAFLFILPWPFTTVPGIQTSSFGGGPQELVISFPPGGGTNSTVELTIPAGATVISALMNITGLPQIYTGSLNYSIPEKLGTVPSSLNLTFDGQGARLSSFNWSRVQTSDPDFRTDESENISIGGGAHISDAITGGTVNAFTVVSGSELMGMPSVNCTPDGNILVAWGQQWEDGPGPYTPTFDFQKFNASGQKLGPLIQRDTMEKSNYTKPRAVSDLSGGTVFVWDAHNDVNAAHFDSFGNQLGSDVDVGYGFYGSAVVTAVNEMFLSWFSPGSPLLGQYGRWYYLNGTPIRERIFIENYNCGTIFQQDPSGIVSVGDDKSILFASTWKQNDSNYRAGVIRRNSYGILLHDRVFVGGNDSFTTRTSFIILDDGTTAVAYTADYPGRTFEVRCARVAANGTIVGQFALRNGTGTDFFNPSLCRLPGNRFACAWAERQGSLDFDLEGRVFKADGTPEGDIFSLGSASGANASWELCARGNSSLVLVVRSDDPAPYGSIRVEVVELQRALKGHIDSPVLDRAGTVIAEVRQAASTSYSVDVLDAETRNVTASGLRNGDPVRSWSPYILRLNLERTSFNASVSEPAALSFGVATQIRDFFEDEALVYSRNGVILQNGHAVLIDGIFTGMLYSTEIMLPYNAVSLDNISWAADAGVLPILNSRGPGGWSDWEYVQDNPENNLSLTPGDAIKWMLEFQSNSSFRPSIDSISISYSLIHKTGLLLSAPVNISDGGFIGYEVNWTANGTVRALVTTDGGMTYDLAPNGLWKPAGGNGKALQAMLVLEGDGNSSPVLSGFGVDYEAQSRPSGIELEIDGSYRWSPPEGSSLEDGLEVRDFSAPLNAVLARSGGAGSITVPLNFTSRTAGILKVWGLRLLLNLPPVIESSSPLNDTVLEQGASQRFGIVASDPDGEVLEIRWMVDDAPAGAGAFFDYTAPNSEGNHTVAASVFDGRAAAFRSWNVSVIFVDRNRPPVILGRSPSQDAVINETETANFSVLASDPDGQTLRYSWYIDGEKVWASDNLTYRSWYNSSGTHAVSVTVSDGAKTVSTGWNVTVLDRNRAPIITGWRPEKALAARPGATLQFGMNVSDPDGDPVSVSWWVDGRAVDNATSINFTLVAPWSDGLVHAVLAVASDANLTASHEWQVRSIIPNEESGLDLSDPWCLVMTAIAMPIIAAAAILGYRRKRDAG